MKIKLVFILMLLMALSINLTARYYNPDTGRFISADSATPGGGTDLQGLNRYSYCMNNPVVYSDPSGHMPEAFADSAGTLHFKLQARSYDRLRHDVITNYIAQLAPIDYEESLNANWFYKMFNTEVCVVNKSAGTYDFMGEGHSVYYDGSLNFSLGLYNGGYSLLHHPINKAAFFGLTSYLFVGGKLCKGLGAGKVLMGTKVKAFAKNVMQFAGFEAAKEGIYETATGEFNLMSDFAKKTLHSFSADLTAYSMAMYGSPLLKLLPGSIKELLADEEGKALAPIAAGLFMEVFPNLAQPTAKGHSVDTSKMVPDPVTAERDATNTTVGTTERPQTESHGSITPKFQTAEPDRTSTAR